ncbi:copper resistance protein B [Luteibacter sp. 3190]|uniref:copper resistance protein B n=1 Tax=Luteibacter sp. 3190 TaxID=2817736 RepID=UPI00286A3B43|nr:copper resistance protein B [Luteibacter sp. 3190]
MRRFALLVALAVPSAAFAQSMEGMDHGAMHHPGATDAAATPASPDPHADHGIVPAMNHDGGHDMGAMRMGPMQGGSAPADARSPDWSGGVPASSMHGMAMHDMDDTASVGTLLLDRLESYSGQGGHGQSWELDGWYGNDTDKLWLRSEGEREDRRAHDADVELFWGHAVATFWDTQLGLRRDVGEGGGRTWAAFGFQGLAPYWFEVEATAYAAEGGRTAARLRVEYELLLTQRLILQPELEFNAYGKDDDRRGIRSGLSNVEGGLRLRYEIRRGFAPYVGVAWEHLAGGTADLAGEQGRRITDRRWVAGLRLQY